MEDNKKQIEKLKALTETIENLQPLILRLNNIKNSIKKTEELTLTITPRDWISFYFPELPDKEIQQEIKNIFSEFIDKLENACLKRYNDICDAIIFGKV
ncbi:MAG: hypothetical protein IRZ03_18290 [Acidobacterium ailaaui]|nr:hypothetical protein [Pseudacidobacterium ailaaui]